MRAALPVLFTKDDFLFCQVVQQRSRMATQPQLRVIRVSLLLIIEPPQQFRQDERVDHYVEFIDDRYPALRQRHGQKRKKPDERPRAVTLSIEGISTCRPS